MKKLHLLCNAHLDPAWLWRWNEGLAETLSTFRVAADFCEQYDGFVFNHNEALLYEWVETHEPALFERIRKLVKEKKWVIMGGWYLQPDCVMTSGESLLEQIRLGREYFREKFDVEPTTAINFDPFGHSRGLVQILKKSGYDSYIFMRPFEFEGEFLWEGFDGSRVLAHCMHDAYSSGKGKGLEKIKRFLAWDGADTGLCLWGIGNHGGGPSREDLEAINEFRKTAPVEIWHSTAERYVEDVDREKLPVRAESLIPCMAGCYTSMVRIKQAHRRLENSIALTEKAMSYAEMTTGHFFDRESLKEAKKALAFCQFHDILPGSGIKAVEEDGLRTLGYGEELVDRLYNQAFFKLCEGQKKAKDGEIPILVFNPHPYEVTGVFEVEFLLADQNRNADEETLAQVYDKDGRDLPTQNEKPLSSINLDWVKRISFEGTLKPSAVSRFDVRLTTVKKDTLPEKTCPEDFICVSNDRMNVRISCKSGLIERYEVDGKLYVENSGQIEVYKDNEDPWGMTVDRFTDYEGVFTLMSREEANAFAGYPEEAYPNVRVVEDGAVRTRVQAFFHYRRSVEVVEYTIPKQGAYIDVEVLMYSSEPLRMLKYRLDSALSGRPWGETAFGEEPLFDDERECVYHKWCGLRSDEGNLYVVNRGMYGGSFTDRSIKLSLLRTPIYAAHPIDDLPIAPHERFVKHIDMGERTFSFRITTEPLISREGQIYNEAPRPLSFFPSGEGRRQSSVVTVSDPSILLSSVKKTKEGYEWLLFNTEDREKEADVFLHAKGTKRRVAFGKYELVKLTEE